MPSLDPLPSSSPPPTTRDYALAGGRTLVRAALTGTILGAMVGLLVCGVRGRT